jgi:outer membrane receptor for ferric coprogen and ferric-rhodotorulic acid
VRGSLTPEQALTQALSSSSLELVRTTGDGYTVVDAVRGYRLTQAWQLSLNLHNVFDRRYVTCSYACFYGKPRTTIATLGYRW